jgi:pimeloyl-ACP methyl ester carboxylesterase
MIFILMRRPMPDGVREKGYMELGGAGQYVIIRGADKLNPVMIILHGGPGSPAPYVTPLLRIFESDFTIICWDQRGCGRSYLKSPNAEISFDNLLGDLDGLVDYAAERFHQPIVIVRQSWGSVLGTAYAEAHPDKLAGYIGMGQVVNEMEAIRLARTEAARLAREAGSEQDALDIEEGYIFVTPTTYLKYLPWAEEKNMIIQALLSPDFDWDALKMALMPKTESIKMGEALEPLFDAVDNFTPPGKLDIPVVFITGSEDYITPASLTEEYCGLLAAPKKETIILPGVNHNFLLADFKSNYEIIMNALSSVLK